MDGNGKSWLLTWKSGIRLCYYRENFCTHDISPVFSNPWPETKQKEIRTYLTIGRRLPLFVLFIEEEFFYAGYNECRAKIAFLTKMTFWSLHLFNFERIYWWKLCGKIHSQSWSKMSSKLFSCFGFLYKDAQIIGHFSNYVLCSFSRTDLKSG